MTKITDLPVSYRQNSQHGGVINVDVDSPPARMFTVSVVRTIGLASAALPAHYVDGYVPLDDSDFADQDIALQALDQLDS
jgi:hypothetical protein